MESAGSGPNQSGGCRYSCCGDEHLPLYGAGLSIYWHSENEDGLSVTASVCDASNHQKYNVFSQTHIPEYLMEKNTTLDEPSSLQQRLQLVLLKAIRFSISMHNETTF